MSNIQKYGGWDIETADKEADRLGSNNAEFMKLVTGRNVVRFLPPPVDAAWARNEDGKISPFKIVETHYVRLPDKKDPISFACPNRHGGAYCPMCAAAEQRRTSGNTADREAAYELFPKRRVYANAVNREHPEKGVQIIAFGKTVHEALRKIRKENPDDDFTNNVTGFDIIVDKQGEGLKTEYTTMPARKSSPLGNDEWLTQQHDLSRLIKVKTVEEIKELLGVGGKTEKTIEGGKAASKPKTRTAADDLEDVPF